MNRPTDPFFDQRIADWLEDDPRHAPDQVLDTVLAALPLVQQRHASRVLRRFTTMPMLARVAAAAAIGVLAVGGAFSLLRPGSPATVGGPGPTAVGSASPTQPTSTTAPTISPQPSPTGMMSDGRGAHTVTLLADGRVLIAGGFATGQRALASTEIYDPATGAFSPTGVMATGRAEHTATLLADGRVLITGGTDQTALVALASAEIYDPRTGTFTAAGSMAEGRRFHTATLLADGRALVIGGAGASGPLASAELWDPATNTFSPTGSMTAGAGALHTATVLADGRVLVAGGGDDLSGVCFATAELYDPATGTSGPTASMTKPRCGHTATLLADGRVLMTTGTSDWVGDSWQSSAEIFDPKTGKFSPTGSMAHAPAKQTATLLADGRVLIAGGNEIGDQSLASAEIYDPKTGTFGPTGSMADARTLHTATRLSDGRVLVTGGDTVGWNFAGPFLASAELYDPATGTFTPVR